jgi:VWFA-related protein
MVKALLPLIAISALTPAPAAIKVLATVVEQKTGRPLTDLKTGDFAVTEDRSPRRVESAEYERALIDVMLLLDTSLAGGAVQPFAAGLVGQLQPKEQMAVVAFHSSADLIQDFTSSRELLKRAIGSVRYGNSPRLLDALYAAIDGGFAGASFRRILLLLTTGMEGPSRTPERDVIRIARRNGVSIFPVYMAGNERSLFDTLARQTGGASFSLRDMKKANVQPPARIFDVVRGHYTLTLSGNLPPGERVRVEIRRPEKTIVNPRPGHNGPASDAARRPVASLPRAGRPPAQSAGPAAAVRARQTEKASWQGRRCRPPTMGPA